MPKTSHPLGSGCSLHGNSHTSLSWRVHGTLTRAEVQPVSGIPDTRDSIGLGCGRPDASLRGARVLALIRYNT